eukprot:m.342579 g.342579  ORF g.342579 m.342579 type:complete len:1061 (-) comp21581_c0_seq1:62-3244(-)
MTSSAARKKHDFTFKRRINGCRRFEDVVRLCGDESSPQQLSPEIGSHSLHAAVGFWRKREQNPRNKRSTSTTVPYFSEFCTKAKDSIEGMTVRQLSKVLGALPNSPFFENADLVSAVFQRVQKTNTDLDARGSVIALLSVIKIDTSYLKDVSVILRTLQSLYTRLGQLMDVLNPQDVANTVWAFATMLSRKPELVVHPKKEIKQELFNRTEQLCENGKLQGVELANTVWGVAKLEGDAPVLDTERAQRLATTLHSRILAEISKNQPSFSHRDAISTFWALTHWQVSLNLMGIELCGKYEAILAKSISVFNNQDIANTAWGLQQVQSIADQQNLFTPTFIEQVGKQALRSIRSLSPQHLAQVMAFATRCPSSVQAELRYAAQTKLSQQISSLSVQGLTTIAKAMTRDKDDFRQDRTQAHRLMHEMAKRLKNETNSLEKARLLNIVTVAANLYHKGDASSDEAGIVKDTVAMYKTISLELMGCNVSDLSKLLWALGRMECSFDKSESKTLARQLKDAVQQCCDESSKGSGRSHWMRSVVSLVWAMQTTGLYKYVDSSSTVLKTYNLVLDILTTNMCSDGQEDQDNIVQPSELGMLAWTRTLLFQNTDAFAKLLTFDQRLRKRVTECKKLLDWKTASRVDIWMRTVFSERKRKLLRKLSFYTALQLEEETKRGQDLWTTRISEARDKISSSIAGSDTKQNKALLINVHDKKIKSVFKKKGWHPVLWDTYASQKSMETSAKAHLKSILSDKYGACVLVAVGSNDKIEYDFLKAVSVLEQGAPIWIIAKKPVLAHDNGTNGPQLFLKHKSAEAQRVPVKIIHHTFQTWVAELHSSGEHTENKFREKDHIKALKLKIPGFKKNCSWTVRPGLFSGGGLDIMTSYLIEHLPVPQAGAKILDFGCGSGVIGAALLGKEPSIALDMLDANSLAMVTAKQNLDQLNFNHNDVGYYFSDSWTQLPEVCSYDMIVSNPPVHIADENNFDVLKELISGAASRLCAKGKLWIVSQEIVPTGQLLLQSKLYEGIQVTSNGRFAVWSASPCKVTNSENKRKAEDVQEPKTKKKAKH